MAFRQLKCLSDEEDLGNEFGNQVLEFKEDNSSTSETDVPEDSNDNATIKNDNSFVDSEDKEMGKKKNKISLSFKKLKFRIKESSQNFQSFKGYAPLGFSSNSRFDSLESSEQEEPFQDSPISTLMGTRDDIEKNEVLSATRICCRNYSALLMISLGNKCATKVRGD